MKKGDEALPCIILAGRALLVKMLITLEPRYAFGLNYEYFFFLFFFFFFFFDFTLSSYWYAKRGFIEDHSGRLSSFSENVHNSCTAWYICFKFCILMYFNIVQPLE